VPVLSPLSTLTVLTLLAGCGPHATPMPSEPGSATGPGSAMDSAPVDTAGDAVADASTGTAHDTASVQPEPDPLAGWTLHVDPASRAAQQATAWRASRPADAARMDVLAAQPTATWLGGWTRDPEGTVAARQAAAAAAGQRTVYVVYNIPQRDCGGQSAGGTGNAAEYAAWVESVARGLGGHPSIVILEPDALTLTSCLDAAGRAGRLAMIRAATERLSQAGARVYVDVGHSAWLPVADAAAQLREAGVDAAAGFALNVSNFRDDAETLAYAAQVSAAAGGARFVLDTSRNGLGPKGSEWCNPPGRAVGLPPDTDPPEAGLDARLWVKVPGESDGACNGGPPAGTWWPDYALGLVQRATRVAARPSR
jgi:endoglucanase